MPGFSLFWNMATPNIFWIVSSLAILFLILIKKKINLNK